MHYKSHRVPGDPAPTSVFAEMDRDPVENSRPVAEPDGAGPRIKSVGGMEGDALKRLFTGQRVTRERGPASRPQRSAAAKSVAVGSAAR
jgi:hypothetical protein